MSGAYALHSGAQFQSLIPHGQLNTIGSYSQALHLNQPLRSISQGPNTFTPKKSSNRMSFTVLTYFMCEALGSISVTHNSPKHSQRPRVALALRLGIVPGGAWVTICCVCQALSQQQSYWRQMPKLLYCIYAPPSFLFLLYSFIYFTFKVVIN